MLVVLLVVVMFGRLRRRQDGLRNVGQGCNRIAPRGTSQIGHGKGGRGCCFVVAILLLLLLLQQ